MPSALPLLFSSLLTIIRSFSLSLSLHINEQNVNKPDVLFLKFRIADIQIRIRPRTGVRKGEEICLSPGIICWAWQFESSLKLMN